MIQIEVDDEVFDALKERAEPFVDTPNSVLRRELGLVSVEQPTAQRPPPSLEVVRGRRSKQRKSRTRARASTRAPAGSLLPEGEYVEPMLRVIAEKGGRAPAREVIEAVGAIVGDRLTPLDKQKMSSGAIRWHNRIQFTRLRMIDQGLLKRGSPRGLWELTEDGIRRSHDESAA